VIVLLGYSRKYKFTFSNLPQHHALTMFYPKKSRATLRTSDASGGCSRGHTAHICTFNRYPHTVLGVVCVLQTRFDFHNFQTKFLNLLTVGLFMSKDFRVRSFRVTTVTKINNIIIVAVRSSTCFTSRVVRPSHY
jgi:hypothetical protein